VKEFVKLLRSNWQILHPVGMKKTTTTICQDRQFLSQDLNMEPPKHE